jgi:hypothetical protein
MGKRALALLQPQPAAGVDVKGEAASRGARNRAAPLALPPLFGYHSAAVRHQSRVNAVVDPSPSARCRRTDERSAGRQAS